MSADVIITICILLGAIQKKSGDTDTDAARFYRRAWCFHHARCLGYSSPSNAAKSNSSEKRSVLSSGLRWLVVGTR